MSRPATSAFQALDKTTFRHVYRLAACCRAHHLTIRRPQFATSSTPTPANPRSALFSRQARARPFTIHRPYSTATGTAAINSRGPSDNANRHHEHDHEAHGQDDALSQSARPPTKTCWQCDASIPYLSMHCERDDCGVIQRAPEEREVNYFEVLGAGLGEDGTIPTFDIDLKTLRAKFLRVQQQVHPDSYSQKSEREHTHAETQSSFINKAYHTLRNPLTRTHYMLKLRDVHIAEAESLEDPELLMEVLEAREELEEATSEEEVGELKKRNDVRINETVTALSCAFADDNMDAAKMLAIRLQYWENIRHAAVEWAPGKRVELAH